MFWWLSKSGPINYLFILLNITKGRHYEITKASLCVATRLYKVLLGCDC